MYYLRPVLKENVPQSGWQDGIRQPARLDPLSRHGLSVDTELTSHLIIAILDLGIWDT